MLVFDLETDGLLGELTRIHCINVIDRRDGRFLRFNRGRLDDGTPIPCDGSIEDGVALLGAAEEVGGHNIFGFDLPAIEKLFPLWHRPAKCRDSMVEARLLWANIKDHDDKSVRRRKYPEWFTKKRYVGSHALGAWGARLGVLKGEYEGGWDVFTQDMFDYADQDPVVTVALFDKIDEKAVELEAAEALILENEVAEIICRQEAHGFDFNVTEAEKLQAELEVELARLSDELRRTFKPWWQPVRKGGKVEVLTPKTRNAKMGYAAGCPLSKVEEVVFNPASRDHIANRMITLFGWTPVEYTDTGKPKVDETTLTGLNYPEAKLLVLYLTVEKRLGQLATGKQAWLSAVKADGRIHGRVNTCGAVTRRMTHSSPNVAQVPSCGSLYGSACRMLFKVPAGYRLVGCDAAGLELRMLAHYLTRFDNGAYVAAIVSGTKEDGTEPHSLTKKAVELNSRDSAKTFIYAYLYGAGNLKLGSIIYDDFTDAQRTAFNAKFPPGEAREKALIGLGIRARRRIETGLNGLGRLQELVKDKAKRGFIKTVDGFQLPIRHRHAALNTLLQGGGAVVMKKALVIAYRTMLARGWRWDEDFAFVANVHDEFQIKVREDLAEEAGRIAAQSIKEAGECFRLQCPLAGDYAIGHNWAETH